MPLHDTLKYKPSPRHAYKIKKRAVEARIFHALSLIKSLNTLFNINDRRLCTHR